MKRLLACVEGRLRVCLLRWFNRELVELAPESPDNQYHLNK